MVRVKKSKKIQNNSKLKNYQTPYRPILKLGSQNPGYFSVKSIRKQYIEIKTCS